MLRACDFMQKDVVTVRVGDPLDEVERIFVDEGIHGAPVIDPSGRVVGLVSASDLLRGRSEDARYEEGDSESDLEIVHECVSDVMTHGTVRVRPDAPLGQVARTMRDRNVHRVIVMEGEEVLGLISSFDLLRALDDSVLQDDED